MLKKVITVWTEIGDIYEIKMTKNLWVFFWIEGCMYVRNLAFVVELYLEV